MRHIWFNPEPPNPPIRLPRQMPKKIVPSFIGESGQVLNLLMHHGAGGVVRDYSGFSNHGTFAAPPNNPTWIDGSYGWALNFNASNVDVPYAASLDAFIALTIELWIYPTAYGPPIFRNIVEKNWSPNGSFLLTLDSVTAQRVAFGAKNNVGGTVSVWNNGITALNAWYHVMAIWDGVQAIVYVNNVAGPAGAFAGTMTINAVIIFGGRALTPFLGILALPRIYNRALTASERTRHFESTRSIFGV